MCTIDPDPHCHGSAQAGGRHLWCVGIEPGKRGISTVSQGNVQGYLQPKKTSTSTVWYVPFRKMAWGHIGVTPCGDSLRMTDILVTPFHRTGPRHHTANDSRSQDQFDRLQFHATWPSTDVRGQMTGTYIILYPYPPVNRYEKQHIWFHFSFHQIPWVTGPDQFCLQHGSSKGHGMHGGTARWKSKSKLDWYPILAISWHTGFWGKSEIHGSYWWFQLHASLCPERCGRHARISARAGKTFRHMRGFSGPFRKGCRTKIMGWPTHDSWFVSRSQKIVAAKDELNTNK